ELFRQGKIQRKFVEAAGSRPPGFGAIYSGGGQWTGSALEIPQVNSLVIHHAVLPAAKQDADPFVGQGADRRMVSFLVVLALMVVIGSRPCRVRDGTGSELMERLP